MKHPQQLGTFTRAALVLLRLAAAAEVFRVGYLVGSYRQGMDCTRRLVELRSPLGGEIAAIIRSRVGRMRRNAAVCCSTRPAYGKPAVQACPRLLCCPAHACTFQVRTLFDCLTVLLSLHVCLFVFLNAAQDPQHPLLKYERQPAEMLEDGTRPRIVNEARGSTHWLLGQ